MNHTDLRAVFVPFIMSEHIRQKRLTEIEPFSKVCHCQFNFYRKILIILQALEKLEGNARDLLEAWAVFQSRLKNIERRPNRTQEMEKISDISIQIDKLLSSKPCVSSSFSDINYITK